MREKISSKYTTDYKSEYQQGFRNRVLKNKLDITRKREMALILDLLVARENNLLRMFTQCNLD